MSAVAIVGAGAIARASAALLAGRGHAAALWSPSGAGTAALAAGPAPGRRRLRYDGCLSGVADVGVLGDPAALSGYDTVLIALPGHAYHAVLPRVVPHLRAAQTVIVSGALSLVPLWLHERSGRPGARPTIAAWGTTLATARLPDPAGVQINTVRASFEVAAIPAAARDDALALCRDLFGERFTPAASVLETALLNVNPVAHAAEVLCNLTRIDKRERWPLFDCLTPSAARIGEAIDAERQAVARGFGFEVRSIHEHTHLSYHVPLASYAEMAAAIHATLGSPAGPTTLEHRYVLEDMPFGLAFYEALARIVRVPVPHTAAALTLIGAACGRDLRAGNPLLPQLGLERLSAAALLRRCTGG
jgi:opine dehydrogenase